MLPAKKKLLPDSNEVHLLTDYARTVEAAEWDSMAKATTSLLLGQEHFDNSASDWTSYEERVQAYLRANNVPKERKVDAFISILGAQTYSLLKSIAAPDKPSSKSLESLCELLRK